MKKLIIWLIILALIIISILLVSSTKPPIIDNYSYTKAICDETNYCQDYEISCKGKDLIKMTPITGAAIQFAKDWEDPRDERELCN